MWRPPDHDISKSIGKKHLKVGETRQKSKIAKAYRVKMSSMKRHNEGGVKF